MLPEDLVVEEVYKQIARSRVRLPRIVPNNDGTVHEVTVTTRSTPKSTTTSRSPESVTPVTPDGQPQLPETRFPSRLSTNMWVFGEDRRRGRPRWHPPLPQCRSPWQACNSCSCKTLCDCPPGRPRPWLPWAPTWEQSWHRKPLEEASVGSRRRLRWQVWEMCTTDCNGWWTPRARHLIYAHSRWIPPRKFHPPQQIRSCQHAGTSSSRGLRLHDRGVRTETITEGCAAMHLLLNYHIPTPPDLLHGKSRTLPCSPAGSHSACGLGVAKFQVHRNPC